MKNSKAQRELHSVGAAQQLGLMESWVSPKCLWSLVYWGTHE